MKGQTRLDSNPARQFLTEECDCTGQEIDRVAVDDLYQAYKKWCDSSGFTRLLTKPRFGKEVRNVFTKLPESKVVRDGEVIHRCWIGLKQLCVTTPAVIGVTVL